MFYRGTSLLCALASVEIYVGMEIWERWSSQKKK
jgi:hypothetical protein